MNSKWAQVTFAFFEKFCQFFFEQSKKESHTFIDDSPKTPYLAK